MSKVLVDRELLERCVNQWACCAIVEIPGAEAAWLELRTVAKDAQPAEAEALTKWKQTAEYWYGQYRLVKHGESPEQYPTEGKLDDWHNSYHNP